MNERYLYRVINWKMYQGSEGHMFEVTFNSDSTINTRFWMWMIILSALAAPVHELGHWLVYEMYDVRTHYTFLSVVPLELYNTKLLGEAGGPLLNVVLAATGYLLFAKSKNMNQFGLALSLTNIYSRLLVYGGTLYFHTWAIQDEGIISIVNGTNRYLYYIVFGSFFLFLLFIIFKKIKLSCSGKFDFLTLTILLFSVGIYSQLILQENIFKKPPLDYLKAKELYKIMTILNPL